MKARTFLTIGFVGGAIIGGGATFLSVAPTVTTILMKPLEWLVSNLSSPYPSESLSNLLIAFPLMFIYWGCCGALIALLLRFAFGVFRRPDGAESNAPKHPDKPQ